MPEEKEPTTAEEPKTPRRLFIPITRETLPRVSDKYPFIYLERGRLEIDDSSIKWIDADGNRVRLPIATINALLLGPGTSVTHEPIKVFPTHVGVFPDFYQKLADLSGNYNATTEYQNQLLEAQARIYAESLGPGHEKYIEQWKELMQLQNSRDGWDGARRSVLAFYSEATDFGKGFEQATTNMLDSISGAFQITTDGLVVKRTARLSRITASASGAAKGTSLNICSRRTPFGWRSAKGPTRTA